MKNFLLVLGLLIGFFGLSLLVIGTYITSKPIDITSIVHRWLPLPIIMGADKAHPAGRLTFDKLVVTWPVQKQGLSAPLYIDVEGLKLLDAKGVVQDSLNQGQVVISAKALLHKTIEPLSVYISGVKLHLKRGSDKKIQLDLSEQRNGSKSSSIRFNLMHLRQVNAQQGYVRFIDEIDHRTLKLQNFDIHLNPFYVDHTLAVIGQIRMQFDINGRKVDIQASSQQDPNTLITHQSLKQNRTLQWQIKLDEVNPADFAEIMPSLNSLKDIDLPISTTAIIGFNIQKNQSIFTPYDVLLDVKMGRGKVAVNNQALYPSAVQGRIHVTLPPDLHKPVHAEIQKIVLQLRDPETLNDDKSGPFFQFKGDIGLSSLVQTKDVDISFSAFSPTLNFATIKKYWPATVAKGAYAWVTENITKGITSDFNIDVGLSSHTGLHHLELTHLSGGIQNAKDVEIHWLRPVPPLQKMSAQLEFVDTDRIKIMYQGGYQVVYPNNKPTEQFHKLLVPQGEMWITGLNNHQETGIITPTIQGRLQDVLALLSEPRLRLLSRHPIPFKNPSGDVTTQLRVELPLKKKVKIEQVLIHGHNVIKNAYLGDVALGKDLKQTSLVIDVDSKHLELTGKGIFSVFPVTLSYAQNFYHQQNNSLVENAQAKLEITPATLKKMGVDTVGDLSGVTELLVDYKKLYDGRSWVKLKFDLTQAEIKLPIWQKPIGQYSVMAGDIALYKNQLISIQNLYAKGTDLSVVANINVYQHIPQQLNITSFKIGRSVGQATLNFPMTKAAIDNPSKGDIRLSIKAKILDAVPFIKKYIGNDQTKAANSKKGKKYQVPVAATGRYLGPKGRRWVVNLQAQEIYYSQNQSLSAVTAYMEYNGVRLMRLSYGMRKPFLVTASLFPKNQYRYFYLEARDFGQLLQTFGITTQFEGGDAVFEGKFNDSNPSAPFTGSVNIKDFTLKHAPYAMRKLSDASIYGLFKTRKNKEIVLDELKGKLFFDEGRLKIIDGLVYNAELGATLEGGISFDHSSLDLEGTIVPAYAINRLFGRLPGIGKWLSPEKGGGFIAVPFDIKGRFSDPQFDIYPSRILTPGALRKLF
ncbi:AsmA-like C-terminal region-containing protein [Commensalibacter oyaizuii]|uniref:AsmA-like C-terminal region-containing protein n=1 Tax=Commensalibacter oyaizuii TaxID=3043873 RepID=A0ABT6Q0T0_9PROT|nr:AsmA-like C-terminal region-containing protein [Commensalibacter sp. TBRC 16381]MDI2090705.1 AsmA-like C-terminal region-containing protein [Commensalibacter sp. TBRC 16381]